MIARRVKSVLKPWVSTPAWAPWVTAAKCAREIRALEQRVEAARGAVGPPQRTMHKWQYEDLQ